MAKIVAITGCPTGVAHTYSKVSPAGGARP
jgi:fructose-specific phosphotransferase system component IIB